jgi:hypothetical protein
VTEPAYRLFPSIERLLVAVLEPVIAAPVTAELPHDFQEPNGEAFELPVVVVDRIAGSDLDWKMDRPIFDVDVYASTRQEAQDISEQIRAYLRFELPGMRVDFEGYGVVFGRVRTVVGPRTLNHPDSRIRRYSANYEALLHPSP